MKPESMAEQQPEKIGRYTVEQVVGQGAMGIVYKGRDPGIGRSVAIKIVARHLLTHRAFTERFLAEARSAGQLSHPNILTIHDLGEDDGVPFLVMEYLPGKDLRQMIDTREPVSIGKKIDIMVQVARGLSHAHRRHVYHRDVKPGNIRLLADGQVKIMDFGVAKLLSEAPSELTQTGTIVGTGHYMSPEQIQGLAIDQRSDIFSFGVVLYEILTLKKPFDGETFTQVMYKIVHEKPAPLPAALRIPSPLVALVDQCLEKDPRNRPSDFGPVVRTLESLADELAEDSDVYYGSEVSRLISESDRLRREGRAEQAITALERARELSPTSREIEHRLERARHEETVEGGIRAGDELFEAGKPEEALVRYRQVLRLDPDSAPARLAIQRAEKLLDEMLQKKDESERIAKLLTAGRDLLQVKQVKQAADCFDQVLALVPTHPQAKALKAECEAAQIRLDHIAELIEEGRKQFAALNLEAAERALEEVRKLDSTHFQAAELRREVERMRGARRAFDGAEEAVGHRDWDAAAARFRDVLDLEPGFPGAREALARAEREIAAERERREEETRKRREAEAKEREKRRAEERAASAAAANEERTVVAEPYGMRIPESAPPSSATGGAGLRPHAGAAVGGAAEAGTLAGQVAPPLTSPPHATSPDVAPDVPAGAPARRSRTAAIAAALTLLVLAGVWALTAGRRTDRAPSVQAPAAVQAPESPGAATGGQEPPAPAAAKPDTAAKREALAQRDRETEGLQAASLKARDEARGAKEDARRKEALRLAPELYRQAEVAEERADDALLAQSFAAATDSYGAARRGYRQAGEAAVRAKAKETAARETAVNESVPKPAMPSPAEPPPAPAATPPRVETAGPGAATADAAEAKRAGELATAAAALAADLDATYPHFAAGNEDEARGRAALRENRFPDAVRAFEAAIQNYEAAKGGRAQQEAQVADLLRRYEAAFESGDILALEEVAVLDATERQRWSQFFKLASEIRADVTRGATKYDAEGAQVGAQVKLSYLGTERKRVDTHFEKALYATERNGRWMLLSK